MSERPEFKPNSKKSAARRVEMLATLLDSRFELGPVRFGWDAILGLIPGIGDSLASLTSTFIIYEAYSHGMSKSTISRMIGNVFIDSILGAVPFLGDFADVFWKSNRKNAELFRQEASRPGPTAAKSAVWMMVALVSLIFAALLSVYLPIKILMLIFNA